jgi:hypothetical protein
MDPTLAIALQLVPLAPHDAPTRPASQASPKGGVFEKTGRWSLIECNARKSDEEPDHGLRAEGRRHLHGFVSSDIIVKDFVPDLPIYSLYRYISVGHGQ